LPDDGPVCAVDFEDGGNVPAGYQVVAVCVFGGTVEVEVVPGVVWGKGVEGAFVGEGEGAGWDGSVGNL
jgi:hypothetical protein